MKTDDADDAPGATLTQSRSAADAAPSAAPMRFGRYIVLDVLGRGGMGVVYSAYDPELDRRVALKRLLPAAGKDPSRLLREAQALAKLQHPNVVAVHDVGILDDSVFLTMELVDGVTLARWLEAEPRSWRQVLDLFREAGRGLIAAHAVGLVHRDFKPSNVLVGRDGRVRVADFGLARAVAGSDDNTVAAPSPEWSPRRSLHETITRAGAVMGTPSYMAPEQFRSQPADTRTDQFSFCVSLYRALYGERPFAGEDFGSLAESVTSGQVQAPPKDSRVPGWVRDVVLRGLSSAPERRWPSMAALVEALLVDPAARSRRRAFTALAVAAVVASVGIGYRAVGRREQLLCSGAGDKVAAVWTSARREAMRKSFSATKLPYADGAFAGAVAALNRYFGDWSAAYRDACQATRIRGEQSEEALDLRMACLDDRLQQAKADVDVLAAADGDVVRRAPQMASGLAPLDACADVTALRGPTRPPDAATRARVEQIRSALRRARALSDAGKYRQALPIVKQAVDDANGTHYRQVQAQALYRLGWVQRKVGTEAEATHAYEESALAARAARDVDTEVEALALLVRIESLHDALRAEALARRAFAALESFDRPHDLPLLSLLESYGSLLYLEGKQEQALEQASRGLALAERVHGPENIHVAFWHASLAFTLTQLGRHAEAEQHGRRAVAIDEKVLGPRHPDLPDALLSLGEALIPLGRYDDALAVFRRAISIWEEAFGPMHRRLVSPFFFVGHIQLLRKQYAEAIASEQHAVMIGDAVAKDFGPTASALCKLGDGLRATNRLDEAAAAYQRTIAIYEKSFGPQSGELLPALTGLGETELMRHAPERALPLLERGLAVATKNPGATDPEERGNVRFALAKTLTLLGRDRGRAYELAVAARADLVAAGPPSKDDLAALAAWMAQQHD